MSKYSSKDLKIEVDDSGGTAQDLSEYIDSIDDFSLEVEIQESTPFGAEWREYISTKVKQADEITFEGFFDDSDNGPDDVLNAIGDTREVRIAWDGNSENDTFDAIIQNYARTATAGELTRFTCTLRPTGEVT